MSPSCSSSFFNQFGPNATTWLVAGEIFPTDIRATMHGIAACMGKLGAIIAALWISYISDKRKVSVALVAVARSLPHQGAQQDECFSDHY